MIRRNIFWALGAGVVLFPGLDLVAVAGRCRSTAQAALGCLWPEVFRDIARKAVASLLSSIGAVGLEYPGRQQRSRSGRSLARRWALSAAAATHAVGTVFADALRDRRHRCSTSTLTPSAPTFRASLSMPRATSLLKTDGAKGIRRRSPTTQLRSRRSLLAWAGIASGCKPPGWAAPASRRRA